MPEDNSERKRVDHNLKYYLWSDTYRKCLDPVMVIKTERPHTIPFATNIPKRIPWINQFHWIRGVVLIEEMWKALKLHFVGIQQLPSFFFSGFTYLRCCVAQIGPVAGPQGSLWILNFTATVVVQLGLMTRVKPTRTRMAIAGKGQVSCLWFDSININYVVIS